MKIIQFIKRLLTQPLMIKVSTYPMILGNQQLQLAVINITGLGLITCNKQKKLILGKALFTFTLPNQENKLHFYSILRKTSYLLKKVYYLNTIKTNTIYHKKLLNKRFSMIQKQEKINITTPLRPKLKPIRIRIDYLSLLKK